MMLNPCIYCKSNERLEFIEVSTLNFTDGIAVECSLCGCRGMAANAEDGEEMAARLWNDLHVIPEDKPTSWVCGECGYQNNGFRKVCGGCRNLAKKEVGRIIDEVFGEYVRTDDADVQRVYDAIIESLADGENSRHTKHTKNCVLRSGGYACTCGAELRDKKIKNGGL